MTTIVLTAAETAALAAGGSITITGTQAAPVTPTPSPIPTPTPPSPSTSDIWVYYKGKFNWAGDWSGISGINYNCTSVKGVDGTSPCIQIPSASQWEYWLPYPPVTANSPASNGIGCNLTGKTHFTVAIMPTVAGMSAGMSFYKADAVAVDIGFGNSVTVNSANYGPVTMVPNQWNVYTVPLSGFGIGTPGWIYKFILQQQGTTPQEWYLDQVGFS